MDKTDKNGWRAPSNQRAQVSEDREDRSLPRCIDDSESARGLFPEVYVELRRLASLYLSGERKDHTLQATALVHETYLTIAKYNRIDWKSHTHLVTMASQIMRQLLVNHAKARATEKRGGGRVKLPLDEVVHLLAEWGTDIVELNDALGILAEFSPRVAQVVDLRFFGGLAMREVAQLLGDFSGYGGEGLGTGSSLAPSSVGERKSPQRMLAGSTWTPRTKGIGSFFILSSEERPDVDRFGAIRKNSADLRTSSHNRTRADGELLGRKMSRRSRTPT